MRCSGKSRTWSAHLAPSLLTAPVRIEDADGAPAPPARPMRPLATWQTLRWRFAALGLVLAAGAPLGLLAVRAARAVPTVSWARDEIGNDGVTFAYVWVSTCAAFATFGFLLGRKTDAIIALSTTDGLTGVANRRALQTVLERETTRASRYGTPVSLLLLDVDNLKTINDEGGHAAGDAALRSIATVLASESRASDAIARWGGDEFAFLAPHTGAADAAAIAERIRKKVSASPTKRPLTVSIGVATREPPASDDPAVLVRRADDALYEAKRRGRNRVAVADGAQSFRLQPPAPQE